MTSSRIKYSSGDLTRLQQPGLRIDRSLRRRLWFFKILVKPCPRDDPNTTMSNQPIRSLTRRVGDQQYPIPVIERLCPGSSNLSHRDNQISAIPVRVSKRSVKVKSDDYHTNSSVPRCLTPINITEDFHKRHKRYLTRNPSFVYANIRSIFNKIEEVDLLLRKHHTDIALFVESWLNKDVLDNFVSIDGYNIIRRDRISGKGGGIICYVKNDIIPTVIDSTHIPSLSICNSEFLTVFFGQMSLLLIGIYHPFWNCPDEHESAISTITDIIDYAMVNEQYFGNPRVVIFGDFNDLSKFYDEISILTQLHPMVSFTTRGDKTLDQLFSNITDYQDPVMIPPIGRSDHVSILWKPRGKVRSTSFVKVKVRKFSKSKMAGFCDIVNNTDWLSYIKDHDDLHDAVDSFNCCLYSLFNHYFPERVVRLRSNEEPWMRMSLKILINDRDIAYKKKQTAKYLRLREEVIKHTKYLKSKYLRDVISSGNVKNLYDAVKVVGKSKKDGNNTLSRISCDEFSSHFQSNFQHDPKLSDSYSVDYSNLPSMPLEVSTLTVDEFLCGLRRKSCGPDSLPHWVFRNNHVALAPAVTYMVNESIRSGCVPTFLKRANVIPVPKCNNPSNLNEFRPISLLPILTKLLEKIVVKKWLLPQICDKLDMNQFAYIPGHGKGTSCALTYIYLHILRYLDSSSGAARVVTIDLSKAFDKLLHSTIIDVCLKFRLSRELVMWIVDYLSGRQQRVCFNGSSSGWENISSGVAQGSVVGPVLFTMVMDSLTATSSNSIYVKYADDLTILHFLRKPSDDKLQLELDHVSQWTSQNGLLINESKSHIMDIVTKTSLLTSPVHLSDIPLKRVDNLNILGCILSRDLRWNSYVDFIIKKASKRIFLIVHLKRSGCPNALIWKAYVVFIRPILLYCYSTFCNIPRYLRRKLLRIEKRVSRIIGEENVQNPKPIFSAGDSICDSMFEKVKTDKSHPLRTFFAERDLSRSSRNQCPLKRPATKTSRYRDSFVKYCE